MTSSGPIIAVIVLLSALAVPFIIAPIIGAFVTLGF
jgi:hypothetical protein